MTARKPSYREKVIEEYHAERIRRGVEFGECFCGCGCKTTISDGSDFNHGVVQGFPRRFMCGHGKKMGDRRPEYIVQDCGYKTPCWIWQRATHGTRYGGRYGTARRNPGDKIPVHAYVLVWERFRGPVPSGLDLDHLCRITLCVNPDHLEPVPHVINVRRGKNTRLSLEDATEIRRLRISENLQYGEIANRFGISCSHARAICMGWKWKEEGAPIAPLAYRPRRSTEAHTPCPEQPQKVPERK